MAKRQGEATMASPSASVNAKPLKTSAPQAMQAIDTTLSAKEKAAQHTNMVKEQA